MISHSRLCSLVVSLLWLAAPLAAQQEAEPLFRSNDTVSLQISAPWRDLQRDDETESWPATLSWQDASGGRQTLPLTVERRGISRLRACKFPPIRLRFDGRVEDGGLFDHQKSLKLVTHCQSSPRWEQYYILEMLAYRVYNLISDYSFRVRPLEVVYQEVADDELPDPRFAFVIEDDQAVAKRLGLKKLDVEDTRPSRLEPLEASRLALFQMMIGNLDWSPLTGPDEDCCHNTKLIGGDPLNDPVIALPYDFDSTGLVDPPYAAPPANLPVRSIRERMYRGYCAHSGTLGQARVQLRQLRGAIYDLFEAEARLDSRSRKQALRYLDSFYDILEDDKDFEKEIVSQCRG